jgi:hypothetical protein
MMTLSAITGTQPVQPATPATQASKKPAPANSQPSASTQDTVHLSGAAQSQLSAMKAAVQEASETPEQTAKEAQSGDLQAQRLMAREAAAAKAAEGS